MTTWEFDDRRWLVATNVLHPGESITWSSKKQDEFSGEYVYKTLTKTVFGDITFLVENADKSKVLTVGTIPYYGSVQEVRINNE